MSGYTIPEIFQKCCIKDKIEGEKALEELRIDYIATEKDMKFFKEMIAETEDENILH